MEIGKCGSLNMRANSLSLSLSKGDFAAPNFESGPVM